MLDGTAKNVVDRSAKINPICNAIVKNEVDEICSSRLTLIETTVEDASWCRFTLKNGKWFSFSRSPWYRAVDIPVDCYDEQNAPDVYKKIHISFCMPIIGDKRFEIVSSERGGLSKPIMKALLEKAIPRLGN